MRKKGFKYTDLLMILGILAVIAVGIWFERRGIKYDTGQNDSYYLTKKQAKTSKQALAKLETTNLAIYDSKNETSAAMIDNFQRIFVDMKVKTTYVDIAKDSLPDFTEFQTVTVLTPDLEPLGDNAIKLMNWVESGGQVMFAMTLQKDDVVSVIEQRLGVASSSYEYAPVNDVYINKGFMVGHSQSYKIEEPFESSWKVALNDQVKVHMTTGDQDKVPLVWSYDLGEGRVVVDNFGMYVKAMRGFYAASFSLLEEVGVYPVINSVAFTIDDFPAPVPDGDGEFIRRDYNMSFADFLTNVWWPDMLRLSDQYKIKYTGMIIENYGDDISGKVDKQDDTSRFTYFGNLLLKNGGEIAYHGYNHQPLSLGNVDYGDSFNYKTWKNRKAIETTFKELQRFTHQLFPNSDHSVYIPPSNVLSKEGRKVLVDKFPEVKAIASNYFGGDEFTYQQEFETAKDGMVEVPRTTSGFLVDDFNKLTAVSELSMHYVSHHFVHPDDVLDPERGAEAGWAKMFETLTDQMDWLYKSAPGMRNMTASQMAGAIQRYSAVNVKKTVNQDSINLKLGNFVDEAYLLIRFNEGEFGEVKGGKLKQLTGNLYLLHATADEVRIQRK